MTKRNEINSNIQSNELLHLAQTSGAIAASPTHAQSIIQCVIKQNHP